jgi:hypothetical protein
MVSKPMLRKKSLFIVAGMLIVLGIAYFVFIRFLSSKDLSVSLNKQLTALVQQASGGLYKIQIGQITIDGAGSTATLENIALSTDSTVLNGLIAEGRQPTTIYAFTLKKLSLNKADVLAFISSKKASLHKISATGGSVLISRITNNNGYPKKPEKNKNIQQTIASAVDAIQIDTIHADNIDVVYMNVKKQSKTIKNVFLDLYGFLADSAAMADNSRIFLSKKMRLSVDSVKFPLADQVYQLGANKIVLSVADSSILSIQQIYFQSIRRQPLEKLAAKMPFQKDVFDIRAKEIVLDNLNLQALLEDSSIDARLMLINAPDITVFHDNSKPPSTESKIGKYPHQLLKKLPFKIQLPGILVQDGTVTYLEKNATGSAIGKVQFSQLQGKVGPVVRGYPGMPVLKANFKARFMNSANISAAFEFPESKDGRFSVNAGFSPFSATAINPAALPLGNTSIKNGQINRLQFRVTGSNYAATGTTTLNYEALQITVMKTDHQQGYEKNKLLSLVANTFFLRGNNGPTDKFKDTYTVTYQRVPTKSFFNLIWKTVFYGVKANTGIGDRGKDKDRAKIH